MVKLKHENLSTVIASVDWGFTNPGTIQVWAVDKDGRMYLVYEVYKTGMLIEWWVAKAKELKDHFRIRRFYCDPSEPAFIAAFKKAGLPVSPADNQVRIGIQTVQGRIQVVGDKKPRLFLLQGSLEEQDPVLSDNKKPTSLQDEIPGYVWANKTKKEEPVKLDDHACDAMRYAVMAIEKRHDQDWFEPEIV